VAVPLYYELSFTVGTTQPAEGSTITQGGVTATVKRVVLESGAWSGTAAGRYIITAPSGGSFAAGALAGGAGTVPAAGTGVYLGSAITLSPGGSVATDLYNFTGSTSTIRLYGCDGVNREFELGDDILVPLTTGMGSIRATCVRAHKYHLFFAFIGSLQHSSIGLPYQWSPITGAGEIGTGDTITNLLSIGGSESNAALMVLCSKSIHVLYGNSAADPWRFITQSRVSGAQRRAAFDIGGVVAFTTVGAVNYPTTQAFGNFLWERLSLKIDPLVKGKIVDTSVHVTATSKWRLFFSDGTGLCGFPATRRQSDGTQAQSWDWTVLSLPTRIVMAVEGDISGIARTFYGDINGAIYEADVGRSFAGAPISYSITFAPLTQGSPLMIKSYKGLQIELVPESACVINTSGDYTESDLSATQALPSYGAGLVWGLGNYGQTYWGVPQMSRNRAPLEGLGTQVVITLGNSSATELPHTVTALTVLHVPRRMTR
jgi:hypothetical protein